MKTPIVVYVETRDGDPDRCSHHCPYDDEWGTASDVRWCHCCQDITVNRLRCPACLDGEERAKGGRK